MNCKFEYVGNTINNILLSLFPNENELIKKCNTTPPVAKFSDKFDITANHAMIFASKLKLNPNEIGKDIINKLNEKLENIQNIECISGFVNIKMKPIFWQDVIKDAIKPNYGFANYGNNEMINVEFVSANPTGPMHIGHARGAIYGDIICRILEKSGYNVIREYYINDAGAQMVKVIDSLIFRAKQIVNNNFSAQIPEGLYPGEYLIDAAKAVLEKFDNDIINDKHYSEKIWQFVVDYMLNLIKEDLNKLGVKHDVFFSEASLTKNGDVNKAIDYLKSKGLIYTGILEKPKGDENPEWEEKEQLLFASSKFGDDMDRPIKKSDGSWAYFAPDIAYHYNKFKRGANKMILVVGSDHKGYKKRISAAVNAMSDGLASIDVKLSEIVNFVKNGQPVKMSKRAGNFLTLNDVLNDIDPQILRFFMITKKSDTVVDFDFDKVMEQSKDNPIFYIQYAHARCCSLISKFVEMNTNTNDDTSLLTHEKQIEVLRKIAQFPRIIKHCVNICEPHLISVYLLELVSTFHSLWSVEDLKFVSDNVKQNEANMLLVKSVKNVISIALDCFGVKPVERM